MRGVVVLLLVGTALTACGGDDDDSSGAATASASQSLTTTAAPASAPSAQCTPLTEEEIASLVGEGNENWKGTGTVNVTSAAKTPTTGTDFTNIVYLNTDQGNFVFALDGDDVDNPDGLLVGADENTRASWTWGDAASPDSPIATMAAEAVSAAGTC